jgi:hypothetical protein
MLKVYDAEHVGDAQQVRDLLEARGIDAHVFGEHTYNALGVNPLAWPAVWIMDDGDFDTAKALVRDYEEELRRAAARSTDTSPRWRCRYCGEWNEDNFAVCWKCGVSLPDQ